MDPKQHFIDLAGSCDRNGQVVAAEAIDLQLLKTASFDKVSQYVGAIGYVLKQHRAMANCLRRKRVGSNQPMQDIVLSCLKEYQDSQDYADTDWTKKYAEVIQQRPELFDMAHLAFIEAVDEANEIGQDIHNVMQVREILREAGQTDEYLDNLASTLEALGGMLVQEAESIGFTKTAQYNRPDSPRGNWSQFWSPSETTWWNPLSWWQSHRERGQKKDLRYDAEKLQKLLQEMRVTAQRQYSTIAKLKTQTQSAMLRGKNLDPAAQQDMQQIYNSLAQIEAGTNINDAILALGQSLKSVQQNPNLVAGGPITAVLGEIKNQVAGMQQVANEMDGQVNEMWQIFQDLTQRPAIENNINVRENLATALQDVTNSPFDMEAYKRTERAVANVLNTAEGRRQQWSTETPESLPRGASPAGAGNGTGAGTGAGGGGAGAGAGGGAGGATSSVDMSQLGQQAESYAQSLTDENEIRDIMDTIGPISLIPGLDQQVVDILGAFFNALSQQYQTLTGQPAPAAMGGGTGGGPSNPMPMASARFDMTKESDVKRFFESYMKLAKGLDQVNKELADELDNIMEGMSIDELDKIQTPAVSRVVKD